MKKKQNNLNIWLPEISGFNPLRLQDVYKHGSLIKDFLRKFLIVPWENGLYVSGIHVKYINKKSILDFITKNPDTEDRFYELFIDLVDYAEKLSITGKYIEIEYYRDPNEDYESIIFRICVDTNFEEALKIWDDASQKLSKPNDGVNFFIEVLDTALCRTSPKTRYTV